MPDESLRKLNDVDRLIHEPARLAIISILYAVEEADFLYLMHELELSKGNLSSHLMKLENAGYVKIEKTFQEKKTRTVCRLTETGRAEFETYLHQMELVVKYNQTRKKK